MTVSSEREIAAKYTGDFAWPTVVLFVALVSAYAGVVVAGASGAAPLWLCALVNGVLAYCFYTVHHEANHNNVSGRHTRLRFVDQVLGNAASIPLHLNFVSYAPSHLLHHAHTNEPDRDPDYFMAGPGRAIVPRWVASTILKNVLALPLIGPALPAVLPGKLANGARLFVTRRKGLRYFTQACLAVLLLSFVAGVGVQVLFLWWIPAQIGALILQVWFVWLPHHDFSETSRYRNTRIRGWLGSNVMLLGQDHHLIHHLYPRVPFYRYRALYREIRPSLEQNGARIHFGLRPARA